MPESVFTPSGRGARLPKPGQVRSDRCSHLEQIQQVTPSAQGCEDCLKIGATWVNLRICLVCGHVGCCDSSPNKHATGHFRASGHPLIQSFEAEEEWIWCYIDEESLQP